MKTIYTILFGSISLFGMGQQNINERILNTNEVSGYFSNQGQFFNSYSSGYLSYEAPKGSGINALDGLELRFTGINQYGDTIHSFSQGPTVSNSLYNGSSSDAGYGCTFPPCGYEWRDAMTSFTREEIDLWYNQYLCDQDPNCTTDYGITPELTERILNYFAHGDVSLGQPFFQFPFIDENSNGLYEPSEGDRPWVKGCNSTYLVQTDRGYVADPDHKYMNLNIVSHAYQYYVSSSYLSNVIFLEIEVQTSQYIDVFSEFSTSLIFNGSLGNSTDDYFGCDSTLGLMYYYNGDNFDETIGATLGYGAEPGAIGIVSLDVLPSSIAPYTNDNNWLGITKGEKSDGSNWQNPSGEITKFPYSGNPNLSGDWTMNSEATPLGLDQNGVMVFDEGTIGAETSRKYNFAILFSRSNDRLQSAQDILDQAVNVKDFYANSIEFPCWDGVWGIDEEEISSAFSVYPNPSNSNVTLSSSLGSDAEYALIDESGRVVNKGLLMPNSQSIIDVSTFESGIYFVHVTSKNSNEILKLIVQ